MHHFYCTQWINIKRFSDRYSHFFIGCIEFASTHQARTSTNGKCGWRPADIQALSNLIPVIQYHLTYIFLCIIIESTVNKNVTLCHSAVVLLKCCCTLYWLTLSLDKTGQRTAAWCWLHTKIQQSWCKSLQNTVYFRQAGCFSNANSTHGYKLRKNEQGQNLFRVWIKW